jgi:TonB family protein
MSGALGVTQEIGASSDRRRHARQRLLSLIYAELDRENGGIVLDASESGIAVHAVVPLTDDFLPQLRLKLPGTTGWLETRARVVWTRDARKLAGLQFEDLPDETLRQIRDWLSQEAVIAESEAAFPDTPSENALPAQQPVEPEISEVEPLAAVSRKNTAPISIAADSKARFSTSPAATVPRKPAESAETHEQLLSPALQPHQARPPQLLAEEPRRSSFVYWLLVVLAVVSLGSGWAAGRGKLLPVLRSFRGLIPAAGPSDRVSAAQANQPVAPLKELEIVDANDQRRVISLLAESSQPARAETAPGAPVEPPASVAPTNKPAMNFQIWTLSSPQRSAGFRTSDAAPGAAPQVAEQPSGTPNIAQIGSSPAAIAKPSDVPKPQTMTGVLKRGVLIHRVSPDYPEIAREQHISGTVTLETTVGADGKVRDVRVISGSKVLVQSAIDAVRQWRYTPTLLDGKPIDTEVQVSLVFNLNGNR